MNTLDVKVRVKIHNFDELYSWAKKQFLSFEVVEGVIKKATQKDWEEYDFSIDCPEDQMKFKDMLQIRFIEELTEASAAMDNLDHFFEEITDAFNFFISAYIMLGKDLNSFTNPEDFLRPIANLRIPTLEDMAIWTYGLVHQTGYLCNLLKNRPWSQSNYLVSMVDFNERLGQLWDEFWEYLYLLGMSKEVLFDLFSRKLSVNLFRIESKY